ncbi:MAG: MBL fold metallo-hydrolase, partial [Acidimicrobiia bacterium]
MSDLTPGVASALSPLVRRIVAPNPGPFTGPGTNTYLVGIDEVAVIDPGPDDKRHIDAIVGASMRERVRWVLLTHTHPDHAPGTARLGKPTGAEGRASATRLDKDTDIVPDRIIGEGDTIEGTEFGLEVLH